MTLTDWTLLCSNKPLAVTPFDRWLEGLNVRAITDVNCGGEYEAVFSGASPLSDYDNDDEFDRAVLDLVEHLGPPKDVCAYLEVDLLRCARLRTRCGIIGPDEERMLPYRDKLLMKQAVADVVPVPDFCKVDSSDDVARFVKEHGRAVLKPRFGWGSRDVITVNRRTDNISVPTGPSAGDEPLMIEEYIEGNMLHVDGFAADGAVEVAVTSRYVNDCLSFNDGVCLGSYQLAADSPVSRAALDVAKRALSALPDLGLTLFHLELFEHNDTLIFCEIGARVGGGHIYESLNATFQANVLRPVVRSQTGQAASMPTRQSGTFRGFVLVPPQAGTLRVDDSFVLPEGVTVARFPESLPAHSARATMSLEAIASFLVDGNNPNLVRSRVADTIARVHENFRWQMEESCPN